MSTLLTRFTTLGMKFVNKELGIQTMHIGTTTYLLLMKDTGTIWDLKY
jgi:hypothetical protein